MRRLRLAAGALVLVLAACGGDDGYPKEVIDNFMASCTDEAGATESYCECTIDELQQTMSFEDFQDAEASITSGADDLPRELQAAVDSCVDEL